MRVEISLGSRHQPPRRPRVLQRDGACLREGVARRPWMAGGMGTDEAGTAKANRFRHQPPDPARSATGPHTPRAAPPLHTGASGNSCSSANLPFASSVPASGYSPLKHASQWLARDPPTAS